MNKSVVFFSAVVSMSSYSFGQEKSYKQPPALGIHFTVTDFKTAADIRNSSLSSVLRNDQFGKLDHMSQGLAISYSNGLSDNFDFSSTLSGAVLSYPLNNNPPSGREFLLLEADASIRGKMLSDKYWFVPYVQIGLGASKYSGYWGAFIPVGVGIQVSFFSEAYLMINSQYRMAVSESASYHFVHSIGLVGNIGSSRN